MKRKEAIKILEDHNIWRRWGEWEMTNPIELWEAIDICLEELKK
jgi:hypothetical protein